MRWLETRIPPPVVMALVGALMWWLASVAGVLHVQFQAQGIVALLVGMGGMLLMIVAIIEFVRHKTTVNPMKPESASDLLTSGAFGWSRNPIYLADAMMLAGWMIWLGNPVNILLLAFFVFYITRFQILPEERAMDRLFGKKYQGYCRSVRRWL